MIARAVLATALLLVAGLTSPVAPLSSASGSVVQLQGFNLTLAFLPGFSNLSQYVNNYVGQYPTVGFSGQCSAGILYISNSSKLVCYQPANGTSWNISAPLTLLYQKSPGLQAQIDNELQLDTPWDVGLLYGNLTTTPGFVTVETVNLTTGAIHQATSPVKMGNSIQCDYVGGGNVLIFNDSGSMGQTTYFTNVLNGTSWSSGLSVGFAPNNIYWVWQLGSFLDVQGTRITQLSVTHGSLIAGSSIWFNRSGMSAVNAVDGLMYQGGSGRFAVDLATNLGGYIEVGRVVSGAISQPGSSAYLTSRSAYVQRYSYSSAYLWTANAGQSQLWDPIDNLTYPTPNLVGRQYSSGANGNFEFTDPYTSSVYLSYNETLMGFSSRAPNEYVWATQIPPTSSTFPTSASAPSPTASWAFFAVAAVALVGIVVLVLAVEAKPRR